MKGWAEEEIKNKNLMAPCGLYCGNPLFRGALPCRACGKNVAAALDGSL